MTHHWLFLLSLLWTAVTESPPAAHATSCQGASLVRSDQRVDISSFRCEKPIGPRWQVTKPGLLVWTFVGNTAKAGRSVFIEKYISLVRLCDHCTLWKHSFVCAVSTLYQATHEEHNTKSTTTCWPQPPLSLPRTTV